MTVVGQLHVLSEIKTLDGGDVADIKEPDVGKHLALEDETSNNTTENVDVDLQVGSCIDQCKLLLVSLGSGQLWGVDLPEGRTQVQQGTPVTRHTISVRHPTTQRQRWP